MKKEILFIILAVFLTRVPQLISPNLLLDGDEAIVGLMAKHFSEGQEIPFYFYGQTYGFSFVEVLPISIAFLIFGVSAMAVKLTMLVMFCLGTLLFYATLKHFPTKNKWTPLLVTLLFVAAPVWAVWAMKARGGYISAFLLFPLFTYLLFGKKAETSIWLHLILGLLLMVIFESQPLWLPGMLIFSAFRLFKLQSLKLIGSQITGVIGGYGLFSLLKKIDTRIAGFHSPNVFEMPENLLENVLALPKNIYLNFTGSYYLGQAIEVNEITSLVAAVLTTSLALAIGWVLYRVITKKWDDQLILVSVLPVLASITVAVFLIGYYARYLLPVSGFMFFLIALILAKSDKVKLVNGILIGLIAAGCFSMVNFKDYRFENASEKNLNRMIKSLKKNNIKYVFSQGALLQWQLMFYSNELLIARYRYNSDRYVPYIETVNEGLVSEPDKVALIGPYNPNIPKNAPNISVFGNEFFSFLKPNKAVLEKSGFRFE